MKFHAAFGLALVLGGLPLLAAEKPAGRDFISRMLDPATRMGAFRQFEIDRATKGYWRERWSDPAEFAKGHAKLEVSEIAQPGGAKPHYLVTHLFFDESGRVPESRYSVENFDRLFPAAAGDETLPFSIEATRWYVFDADGKPLMARDDTLFSEGYIQDLNGDGRIEVAEVMRTTLQDSPKLEADVIRIASTEGEAEPSFAVAFNLCAEGNAAAEDWGHCFVRADGAAGYELRLGPVKQTGIEAAVVIRWDAEKHQWASVGAAKAGVNWRLLDPSPAGMLFESGSSGLLRSPQARDVASFVVDLDLHKQLGLLPADAISKPYRARSLADVSNAELLAWMRPARSTYDLGEELTQNATLPEEIWTLEPKAAALGFVTANRPPSMRRHFRLAVAWCVTQQGVSRDTIEVARATLEKGR